MEGWMRELKEGYGWIIVQGQQAARARGVGGAAEAVRGVVLAASHLECNGPTCRGPQAREERTEGPEGVGSGTALGFVARENGLWACGAKRSGARRG